MKKNPAKKTITKIGIRKATSNDEMAFPEPPDVMTKPIMTTRKEKNSENNKNTAPNIQKSVYLAPMLSSIVLPDPFGMTLPLQSGAKLFRDKRRRLRTEN